MAVGDLVLPKGILAACARRFRTSHRSWLAGEGEWPLSFPLGAPTQKQVAEDLSRVRSWITSWREWQSNEVIWEERHWAQVGKASIPVAILFESAEQIAELAGEKKRWQAAIQRYQDLTTRWSALPTILPRHFDVLADYSEADMSRLINMLSWMERNRNSGLYLRQLPIQDVDTKWIESRRALTVDLVRTLLSFEGIGDLYDICGLRRQPNRIRIRLLDSGLCPNLNGLNDIEAPIEQIAAMRLSPKAVIIVENQETGIALPSMPGTVAFMKLGNSVSLLKSVPWLEGVPVTYWGDIDTYGFSILSHARRTLPKTRSILMNMAAMNRYRDLAVTEARQSTVADVSYLTKEECDALNCLLASATESGGVRIEQERIPMQDALHEFKSHNHG